MLLKVRSPFAGKPATRQVADHNGAPAFDVQPRVLTPVRAMAASWLTGLGVVAGLAMASLALPARQTLIAGCDGGYRCSRRRRVRPVRGAAPPLRKRFRLMLTLEQFSVKRCSAGSITTGCCRTAFALLQHD